MTRYQLFFVLLLLCGTSFAQDTIKHVHHRADSTFFTENAGPQQSDYLESLEQVFQVLNKVPIVTSSFLNLDDIEHDLGQNDSAVAILKERMAYTHSLNIRSLQVYNTLLDKLAVTMKGYEDNLDEYRTKLEGLKKDILGLKKDTLIRHIFKDTALHTVFTPQLKRLRSKWHEADSLLKSSTNVIRTYLKSRYLKNKLEERIVMSRNDVKWNSQMNNGLCLLVS